MSNIVDARPDCGTRHTLDTCQGPRDSFSAWHCVFTKPKHERDADQAMKRAGFETFLPRYQMVWRDRTKVIRPLFPCYTFAKFDAAQDPWTFVVRNHVEREVATIMIERTTRRPLTIPSHLVEQLQAQTAADGVIYPPEPRQMHRGDRGNVLDGPLAQFSGICSRTSKDRVWLLLSMLGGQTEVGFKREAVELVA